MKALPRTRSCFVCGESNPLGFRLDLRTDGRIAEARFSFRPEHVGFRQTIHGGLISTILDELMVWGCGVAARRFSYCAEMTVRFRRPIAPGQAVLGQGEMTENRKGRIFVARATLLPAEGGPAFAEATGKYIPMDAEDAAFMGGDFVTDPDGILKLLGASPGSGS